MRREGGREGAKSVGRDRSACEAVAARPNEHLGQGHRPARVVEAPNLRGERVRGDKREIWRASEAPCRATHPARRRRRGRAGAFRKGEMRRGTALLSRAVAPTRRGRPARVSESRGARLAQARGRRIGAADGRGDGLHALSQVLRPIHQVGAVTCVAGIEIRASSLRRAAGKSGLRCRTGFACAALRAADVELHPVAERGCERGCRCQVGWVRSAQLHNQRPVSGHERILVAIMLRASVTGGVNHLHEECYSTPRPSWLGKVLVTSVLHIVAP